MGVFDSAGFVGSLLLQSSLGLPVNTAASAVESATQFAGDWRVLLFGILLIIGAVLVIMFIKKIIINSVLGLIVWGVLYFVLKVELPFIASLAVSAIFGLAGIGCLLLLKFLGIV